MGSRRFERLERERGAGGASPSRPSAIEARFGTPSPAAGGTAPQRSGAEPARFEDAEREEKLRVLDADSGQAFVRCAECRADNHVNASRCINCEADLATPAQRAFNEALWRKLDAEKQEEEERLQALRERRAAAEREQAEALRTRQAMERELERRLELGLPLDDADDVSNPLRAFARSAGRFLGETLVRLLPSRTARLIVLGGAALAVLAFFVAFPGALGVALYGGLILAGLAARRSRSRRRRGGRFGERGVRR
jgi:hypothetical protein